MGLTSAFNAARSGMSVTSRWAESVSSNIANANNASFARRETQIVTDGQGAAKVSEITRAVDASLDAMYRTEVGRTARQDAIATGLAAYTTLLGDSESSDTILTRLTDFRNAMGLLTVSPSDTALQRSTVSDAQQLAGALNRAGSELAEAVESAEGGIASDIAEINAALARLEGYNEQIASGGLGTSEAQLALQDRIGAELDALAEYMDFTLRTDSQGRMELFAAGGAPLLTGGEAELLRFDAATGTLMAGDAEITPGVAGVRGISEGALAGQIELYNTVLPEMQAQLDEVARALIEGLQSADASLADGEPGLFTDAGAALSDPFAPGLAMRIAVNGAVLPESGGEYWRIRDGVGAEMPGAAGDNTQIEAFIGALDGDMPFDSGVGLGDSGTLSSYVSTLIASQNSTRAEAEGAAETLAAGAVTVQSTRLSFMGVNVDDELQQLTAIQQSYNANAQVLTVVAQMIDTLIDAF
ncbi:flagellar hook-associated protein FlgK [Salipiger sp. P9]|uniref:flagellar hook-associated protein FlgK n=1 Tax=Salipiger pentaromativorans TaxID=2943193 RepID=UPI0021581DE6|nr:flagellar hook-associated protein FlgK [Salipiger pentaromativorans]MCR8550498.1 flagellar hook-associated protein FlgK [Salipiger pentaromativorans]